MSEETPRTRKGLDALAALAVSVFWGRRPEDRQARKKAGKWSAVGILCWLVYTSISFGMEWVRHDWTARDREQKEAAAAQKEGAKAMMAVAVNLATLAEKVETTNDLMAMVVTEKSKGTARQIRKPFVPKPEPRAP
jgi:hypothetical protein